MGPSQCLSQSRDFDWCSAFCLPGIEGTFLPSAQKPGTSAWELPVIPCCLSAQGHSSTPTAASGARHVSLPSLIRWELS